MTKLIQGLPPSWTSQTSTENYSPTLVETPAIVLANDSTVIANGWADPPDWNAIDFSTRETHSGNGTLFLDDSGRPQNPAGPTGKAGRILGKWGPNHAADPIVLRHLDDRVEVLAIQRKDTGEWAIPGGMVDADEDAATAAARELREECGATVNFANAHVVFSGVVERDPRNTDHAWMETTALAVVVDGDAALVEPVAGDDAQKAAWVDVTNESLTDFYANHAAFILDAVKWARARVGDASREG